MSYLLIAWIALNAGFALGAYWKASRVERETGPSCSTIYRMMEEGTSPRPAACETGDMPQQLPNFASKPGEDQ